METLRVTLVNVLVVLVFTIHLMAVPEPFCTGPPRPLNLHDTPSVISQMVENILDVYLKATELQQLFKNNKSRILMGKYEKNIRETVPGNFVRIQNRTNNLTYMLMEDYAHLSQAVKAYQRMVDMRNNCTGNEPEFQKLSYSIITALEKSLCYIESEVGVEHLGSFGDLASDIFNATVTPITNDTCQEDRSDPSEREKEEYKQMFTLITYTFFLNDSYVQFKTDL